MNDELRVRPGDDDDVEECLRVLSASYDRPFTREWFQWKHRDCPWGPSRLYIVETDDEMLGLVLALDWPYRRRAADGSVVHVDGTRFVDGATLPASRGRGVLGLMVAAELRTWTDDHPGVLIATATPAARKSHERNGASTLDPIASTFGVPLRPLPAQLVHGDAVVDSYSPDAPGATTDRLRTAWTPDTLRWRIDDRTGRGYRVAALANAEGPNGIVYRVATQRGLPTLFPVLTWGTEREQRRLVGAVAFATRSILVNAPVGEGVDPPLTRPLRSGGATIMCIWDRRRDDGAPPATTGAAWSLTMADLEGLI